MTTYGYDPDSGELSSLTDGPPGSRSTASTTPTGTCLSEAYPNGMTQTTNYDETDTPTSENYLKYLDCVTACTWFTDQVASNIHGEWATQTSNLSTQNYTYDRDARLTQVEDTVNGGRQLTASRSTTSSAGPTSVITGPDGNLWFAEDWVGKVAKITPSGTVTEYSTGIRVGGPMDLAVGPDGNIWFAGAQGNEIGKIDPTRHESHRLFRFPTTTSYPTSIARGAGNTLVFADYWSGKLGVITTSGSISGPILAPDRMGGPRELVQGSDGNDYFVDYNSTTDVEQIGEFNTTDQHTSPNRSL